MSALNAMRHGHAEPIADEHYKWAVAEIDRLSVALHAAFGHMLNAKIDLETGTPKKTTLATLEGGIKTVRAALGAA